MVNPKNQPTVHQSRLAASSSENELTCGSAADLLEWLLPYVKPPPPSQQVIAAALETRQRVAAELTADVHWAEFRNRRLLRTSQQLRGVR